MASSGGRPTVTPAALFRKSRRGREWFRVWTTDIFQTPSLAFRWEYGPAEQRYHKFLESEAGLLKIFIGAPNDNRVSCPFVPSLIIAKKLLHHALLALRIGRKNAAQLARRMKGGVANAPDRARIVENELDRFALALLLAFGREGHLQLFAALADRVELLEAEADGIDQGVATGAAFIGQVHGKALTVRHRPIPSLVGQIGVDAGRRLGHFLAQELLPDEQAAGGGRGIGRLGSSGQEERLAEHPGAFGGGR